MPSAPVVLVLTKLFALPLLPVLFLSLSRSI